MKEIVFATQNVHKVAEIQSQVAGEIRINSLLDLQYTEELAEEQDSLAGNALQKVRFVYEQFKTDAFADDTGLEIEALNGEPGVYSARYAGEGKSFEANMDKVLQNLDGIRNRKAHFKTVIALIYEGKEYLFEGICEGEILQHRQGDKGFGYDPIFKPNGQDLSFAEMSLEQKAKISHRGLAVQKLIDFLNRI